MAVQVYPTETASYCVDSIRRSGRVDTIVREEGNETWIETLPPEPVAPADPGVIRIRWEYRRLDDGACVWVSRAGNESNETENASNATNLSEGNSTGNFSCAMMFWQLRCPVVCRFPFLADDKPGKSQKVDSPSF